MNLVFDKIHIHHFLSIDDALIDLADKGFCLVSGVNKCVEDASKSNGSGKSSIWSAISFALTGQTSQGVKSNLANIYYKDGCYVELEFYVDNVKYKLIRSKDDNVFGTNLKIFVNEEDKSGKGIRESETILAQYLPDLTAELINSVIILGQGLPQKFTSNTPSGRKEMLEHLSKSDFMIEDIKSRLSDRVTVLTEESKKLELKKLSLQQNINLVEEVLKEKEDRLSELLSEDMLSLKNNTAELQLKVEELNEKLKNITAQSESIQKDIDVKNIELTHISEERNKVLDDMSSNFNEWLSNLYTEKESYNSRKLFLDSEIKRVSSLTDICPTCHQKIEGHAVAHSLECTEQELKEVEEVLKEITSDEIDGKNKFAESKQEKQNAYQSQMRKLQEEVNNLSASLKENNLEERKIKDEIAKNERLISENNINLTNYERNKSEYEETIEDSKNKIEEFQKELEETETLYQTNIEHLVVINKMSTLVKRDFRGVLLQETIDFIDSKAKEYCEQIFNTKDLNFCLNGNNIDIIFRDKNYESLSGGEKRRIDLIIQFAIRDMLCKYANLSCNILVLDEITDNLDSVSCDRVVSFITNVLTDISSVYIISHHASELNLGYDNEIVVEKDEKGVSRIC